MKNKILTVAVAATGVLFPALTNASSDNCVYCHGILRNARDLCYMGCYDVDSWMAAFRTVLQNDHNYAQGVALVNVDGEWWAEDILAGDTNDEICEQYCTCSCPENWETKYNGIERGTKYTCDMGECVIDGSTWRCATGYYGTPMSDSSGCTRCPATDGIYGTTNGPGATTATQCYIPAGTQFNDNSGSGTYTANCYYQ